MLVFTVFSLNHGLNANLDHNVDVCIDVTTCVNINACVNANIQTHVYERQQR